LSSQRLTINEYGDGILKGDRFILAKAITLVESQLPTDQKLSTQLIDRIYKHSGQSIRLGITGVPGVGKSSFIESFGKYVISQNKKIAVLTVDPSSEVTKGSILGDKTRMPDLAKNKSAFIRPSSSRETLGGTATATRESILLCEAAGFDVIIVETVGVGQSETAVRNMVDFFLLLMLAGAGDELQGIKKGIMEMADAIAITKADGSNTTKAREAMAEYQQALHLQSLKESGWSPKVFTCSSLTGEGIDKAWILIQQCIDHSKACGYFDLNRSKQKIKWFYDCFDLLLKNALLQSENLKTEKDSLEKNVLSNEVSPVVAARSLMTTFFQQIQKGDISSSQAGL
jgi:LAO/AO transport system kinase